ncbi:hypothetical protein LTR28_008655 [Elasticomyces elasticus]|nr:hypothetical protein LTR28_008655 [Elasticomyces elasticus]
MLSGQADSMRTTSSGGKAELQSASAQRIYDKRARDYDVSWHGSFAAHMVELVKTKSGEDVLDLACGTGLVTFNAASLVGDTGSVTGIDVSSGMLARASEKKPAKNAANVVFFQHDITDLDSLGAISNHKFDVIICASALVLLDDPAAALKHWTTYLKPGGRLVVDAPHPRNIIAGTVLERAGRRAGFQVQCCRDWCQSEESLREVLQAAGLTVELVVPVAQKGEEDKYYSVDEADAYFERFAGFLAEASLSHSEAKEEAKVSFREEWMNAAEDGKVKEVDCVFVGIAHRV